MFQFQLRPRWFWQWVSHNSLPYIALLVQQLEVMVTDTASVADGTVKPPLHQRREQCHPKYPKGCDDGWLMHFTQEKREEAQGPNFLVLPCTAEQCTGSTLRIGPVDVLQTDVRPLPQLILPENNTTLLAEHRDLIIRVPGLSSFFSVCNVPSYGKKNPTQDMAFYPQAVMSWCSCQIYTLLDHCTLWSTPEWACWPTQSNFKAFLDFMSTAEGWTVHGLAWSWAPDLAQGLLPQNYSIYIFLSKHEPTEERPLSLRNDIGNDVGRFIFWPNLNWFQAQSTNYPFTAWAWEISINVLSKETLEAEWGSWHRARVYLIHEDISDYLIFVHLKKKFILISLWLVVYLGAITDR